MSSCIDGLNLHPKSVHDAAIVLSTLTERLIESDDPRAAFTDVYGIVTRAVEAQVQRSDGMFREPAWIARLAGRFCERYLQTLCWREEGAPQDCGAWHVAYACASSRYTLPVQNALLGFSAHINYDLVFGIHATIVEFGHGEDRDMLARLKHDHDQVNTLLQRSVPEALDRLATRHGCAVSTFFRNAAPQTAVWIAMELLTRWRERVWTDVTSLLSARSPGERAALAREIERRSFRIAKLLALPNIHVAPDPALLVLPCLA